MPHVQFFLRSNNDSAQTNVLYCRVSINGTQSEFSTTEKVIREYWDQKSQVYRSPKKSQNEYFETLIDSIRTKIKTTAILLDTSEISARSLISMSQRKSKVVKELPLLRIVSEYISNCTSNPNTIRNHWIKYENLKAYEQETRKQFTGSNFDIPEAFRFIDWFKQRRKTNNVETANRNVLFFRQALYFALNRGDLKTFALLAFKGQKDKVKQPVFLTTDEVIRLIAHEFNSSMLQKCKDLYLFQIATGLSYCDLWGNFSVQDSPSGKVLSGTRGKGSQAFFVPLDELGLALLEKYNGQLPVFCNGVYNRVLKEIAGVLGIEKKLTTHTGRKTFATLRDAEGWSRESVSKMLGHRNMKTTETYYLGQSNERIMNEFERRTGA